eukprot:CAMPEP_0197518456 /NCGR_PEP_ID=MMETSP1318-20131121/3664_1 /TAXON_ID=552666 /ORGANISM="Partenskyella glossopodia, Strain RCC365" /LENGTH=146 /DNA_ID=CAMNT_0043068819 /DNA_START=50 /DNA_END=490 /DNA_ORIENTATION=-
MMKAVVVALALVSCYAIVEKEETQLTSNSSVAFVRGEAVALTAKDLKDESLTMLHKSYAKKHGKDLSEDRARSEKEMYYGQTDAAVRIRLGVHGKDFAKAVGVLAKGDLELAKKCIMNHFGDKPPAWDYPMDDVKIKTFFGKHCKK